MKHIKLLTLLILSSTIMFTSCGNPNDLEGKKSKLENLRKEKQELSAKIAELENEIDQLDTSTTLGRRKVPVILELAEKREFAHFIEVQANAQSKQNILVYPEINGVVKNILVNTGDKVSKGQVLAIIDSEILQRNIDELTTSLELAITMFERQKLLWDQNIGSEVQYLQAKNQKESLERRMASARAQLSKAKVTSPITGTIDHVFLKTGEMANPGFNAFRVVNLDDIEITAEVSEIYAGKFKRGDVAEIFFPTLNLRKVADLRHVGQVINPGDRTFTVEAKFDNSNAFVKPNSMATLRVADYRNPSAVVVPAHAIQHAPNGDFVFVAKEKGNELVASRIFITRGRTYQGQTEVLEGLSGNEKIIVRGYQNISEGELLSVTENPNVVSIK